MKKLLSIPLYFLVIAAAIGLMLRWHLLSPIGELHYGNWLHTHSHVMFLGWLFNFFNLVFLYNAFGDGWQKPFKTLFWINQFLIVGMLFLFPLQGYGYLTIPLSTLHTIVSGIFCVMFIRRSRKVAGDVSRWYAVLALVFFLVSSVGPFALAPIMANGLGGSKWYYFAIYYYLHFQYNGVFFFGVFSIFLKLMEEKGIDSIPHIRIIGWLFFIACFPAYALSVIWAEPSLLWNWIGFLGAAVQAIAFWLLFRGLHVRKKEIQKSFSSLARMLFFLAAASLGLKVLLQLLSALPFVARVAYENRQYVIGYLHLVLIGIISLSILGWYIEKKVLDRINPLWVVFLLGGFAGSELLMACLPSLRILIPYGSLLLFSMSAMMFLGLAGLIFHLGTEKAFRIRTFVLIALFKVSSLCDPDHNSAFDPVHTFVSGSITISNLTG